jgi:DNA-binding GntR family transcriptional regulator
MPDTSERSPRIAAVPLIEPDHTLAARGASALREMILTGVLEMGSRLNEVDLSEAFGISRPPLREAIRSLASQGLLEIVNHKGAFVPSYTAKDLCEIYEVRMALESHAARLLATRCTADDIAQLERILDSAEDAISRGESSAYPNALDFHQLIVGLAGNRHLSDMATSIDQKLQLARIRSGKLPGRAHEALDEHRNILEILTLRDGDAAAELMTQHLRRSLANALRVSVITGAPNGGATPVRDDERPGRTTK